MDDPWPGSVPLQGRQGIRLFQGRVFPVTHLRVRGNGGRRNHHSRDDRKTDFYQTNPPYLDNST